MNDYYSVCYDILKKIYQEDSYSQLTLSEALESRVTDQAPLVTKIVYGVLENDLYLDYLIGKLTEKKPKNAIIIVLKISLYAMKFLNSVPDYAAVNNGVELAKKIGKKQLAGFVNAVLQRAVKEKVALPTDFSERCSVQYSYPLWLVRKLLTQYGQELAEKILSYRGSGKTTVRRNMLTISQEDFENLLKEKKVGYSKEPIADLYEVSHREMLDSGIPLSHYVNQGASSVLVCRAMKIIDRAGILDVCAAPGGKSALMASLSQNGMVRSWDLHPHRVDLMRQYFTRLKVKNIACEVRDASVVHSEFFDSFDYVLADAPCSGFGVALDKPDIKRNRREEDIAGLCRVQRDILEASSRYVKRGGILMYSTCTILAEENQNIVDAFLKSHRDFEATEICLEIEPKLKIGKYVQLLPCLDGIPGFFMARLMRKSA